MIIKIVCASNDSFSRLYQKDDDEMLIGVDGGIIPIINLGLKVDLAIGDFDSCNLDNVKSQLNKIKIYPKEKDYGDFELAIQEVIAYKFDKVLVYNATGGRIDHFLAIINVLIKYVNYDIEIIDENNLIKVINKNTIINKTKYKYCSIYAIEDETIISLKGFKYNINSYKLDRFDNLCLSNEIINEGKIEVNNKKLVIIETN